jgi:hypothetical protein
MAESAVAPVSLDEARTWVGDRVDDVSGSEIGQVHSLFVDADDGAPTWLVAKQGRRFRVTTVAIPIADCAGGGGRVWVAHDRRTVRSSPVVDPGRPLLREHELTIAEHYGIGEAVGRASGVAARGESAVTSRPS